MRGLFGTEPPKLSVRETWSQPTAVAHQADAAASGATVETGKSSRYTPSYRYSIMSHTSSGFCDTRRPPLVVTAEPHMLQSSSGQTCAVYPESDDNHPGQKDPRAGKVCLGGGSKAQAQRAAWPVEALSAFHV